MKMLERIINVRRNRIFWIRAIIGIGTILAFGLDAFADLIWDVARSDYVPTSSEPQSTGQTFPQSSYRVLWDLSHGAVYTPSDYYQPLMQNLASHGFSVDTTDQGFLVDDPTGYHVLVVCLGGAWNISYSSAEVTRITDFVNGGGGLLIMGDNPFCPNANIQPVSSAFGVSLGLSDIMSYETYTSNLASHPIFDGVSQIYMQAAGEISGIVPSNEAAWEEDTGKALVAVGSYSNGRVVTLGDIDCWARYYYDLADNRLFSINTFEYLAIPEPSTLFLLGLGALFLRKKCR